MIGAARLRENVITSCGLRWERAEVDWNEQRLYGQQKKGRHVQIVDFWEQSGIYVLYLNEKVYYVGIAPGSKAIPPRGLGVRLNDHLKDLPESWDRFSWFGTREISLESNGAFRLGPTRKSSDAAVQVWRTLHDMEALLFLLLHPIGNIKAPHFGEREEKRVQQWAQIKRHEVQQNGRFVEPG
jgi:hypothetical protein